MLDAYDKVIKEHTQQFLKIGDKSIPVIMLSGDDDADKQLFTISGSGEKSDVVSLPLIGLVRLGTVDITDNSMTKRQMNYSAYPLQELISSTANLNGMLCNLKYIVIVFAETRKMSEDIGTQLYFRLRNNKQITTTISLPISNGTSKYTTVHIEPEIILDSTLEQVRKQDQEEAQFYRFKFSFTLQHCYILDFSSEQTYNLDWQIYGEIK